MRILVIEDDRKIASFLRRGLTEAGFAVDVAEDGEEGFQLALSDPYDAAVVDLMLPSLDGLSLIAGLRRRKVTTPVLILSPKRSVDDRVRDLYLGGDDYLAKPFAFTELLSRVQALIRRATSVVEPTRLVLGDLAVDLRSREVTRSGQVIELRPREFALLEYLMRSAGRPVSRATILQHVWGYGFEPQANVVDVLVSRLRAKLDRHTPGKLLHTVRGVGYVLRAP